MVNFQRKNVGEFNDLSSIDPYTRSMEAGLSPEEALHFVNLRSRDNARTPFPWNAERYGGFSSVKPWLGMTEEYPALNAAAQRGDPDSVWGFYKDLIAFRQNGPYQECLMDGDIRPLKSTDNVIAYQRMGNGTVLACYFNLSGAAVEEPLTGQSAGLVWHTQKRPDIQNDTLTLSPWQSAIIKMK